jgi:hypothetical protein
MRPLSRLPIPAFSFQFLSWLMIRPDFAILVFCVLHCQLSLLYGCCLNL